MQTLFSLILATQLLGCATHIATLTDDKGQSITCEASGKAGIISHTYLEEGFRDCVEAARSRGFHERGVTK